jgi:transposase InsO family protein
MFKKKAEISYDYPGKTGKLKFKWRTFKKWLYLYRQYGIDGLKPSFRSDKGKSRKIDPGVHAKIKQLFNEKDFKTVSNAYRYLLRNEIITPEDFTEVTLRNFVKNNNIQFRPVEKKARKSFEAPHINVLWTADFMHGPYVRNGKGKAKTYLCAIIDDFSRVIVGAKFYIAESSLCLQITLKNAVLTYGVPQKFYCDNGKVFVSGYIHMVCARLGTALIHSKPYDSPGRGKIERFFLTVRNMFLPNVNIQYEDKLTLEYLNKEFHQWLHMEYLKRTHAGIGEAPIDKYINDIPNVKVRQITSAEIDHIFYHTIYRKVKNDSTVTVNNVLYETPSKFIGKKIEIRFPLDNPEELKIFENNQQIGSLKKLDKHFNSENTIKYHLAEEDNV